MNETEPDVLSALPDDLASPRKDNASMIAGYVIGGLLLAINAGLLTYVVLSWR